MAAVTSTRSPTQPSPPVGPSAYPSYRSTFIGISTSPWSLRARWGLDVRAVPYTYKEYLTMLGEPWLRAKTGQLTGPVTVPVLLHGDLTLTDSLDILRYADRMGDGPRLFPEGRDGDVHRAWWLADALMAAGRIRTTRRVMNDPKALSENLPFNLPGPMLRALNPVAMSGARYLLAKYGDGADDTTLERRMVEALEALTELRAGRDHFVGDDITAADLAVVAALQFVKPLGPAYLKMGKANAACWTEPSLALAFADLVAWRDATAAAL